VVYTASTLFTRGRQVFNKPEITCNHSKESLKRGEVCRGNLAKMKHAATGKEK